MPVALPPRASRRLPFRRIVPHRPTLVLYVDDHGTKRPLVRWPTTIGGWADQRLPDGTLVQRWKESDVGPRIWRDIYAGPTWLPPKSTPDKELVMFDAAGHRAQFEQPDRFVEVLRRVLAQTPG